MEIKEIIIKTDDRIIELTDKDITVKDLEGFPRVKIMHDKIKVKKEIKILKI